MKESIKSALIRAEKSNVLVGHEKFRSKSSPPPTRAFLLRRSYSSRFEELPAQFSFHLVNTNRTPSSSGLTVFSARS